MNEILEKLKVFKDFEFHEYGHYYTHKNDRIDISTTRLIHNYTQPFEAEKIAEKVATKENKTISEVLGEWRIENKFSTTKGTILHELAQSLLCERFYDIPYETLNADIDKKRLEKAIESTYPQIQQFFIDNIDKHEVVGDEVIVGSKEYGIAGSIDMLLKDKQTGEVVMIDFKTNKEIKKKGLRGAKMQVPLQELDDCNYVHYSLQLGLYKYLIEKYTNLKISYYYIVYFNENADKYEIIKPLNVSNEVEKILNLRRVNKMAKMLLVMGEQGSGKSFSLRTLPAKEHYYIDCDKKGMNYKGWKNDYNEESKNYIRCNDGETIINMLKNISEKAPHIKYISIDTINAIMIADELKRSKQKGFDKWDDMANIMLQIIMAVPDLRDDLTVIFLGHTQTNDDGFVQLKTNGRKLNKIGVEGYFNTVLLAKCINAENNEYIFETKANNSTARTPYQAFETMQIPNDILKVIEVIKEY